MTKTLRLSFLMFLSLWCGVVMAQATTSNTDPTVAKNIAAFKKLKNKVTAKLELHDAVVTFVNEFTSTNKETHQPQQNQEIYIEDNTGALCLYNTFLTLKAGDKLSGYIIGNKKNYFGLTELEKNENQTNLDNVEVTSGENIFKTATTEDMKTENIGRMFIWFDATLNKESKGFSIDWKVQKVQVYDRFKYLSKHTELTYPVAKQAVFGILSSYKKTLQINITDLKEATDNIHKVLPASMEKDAIYNLSGQRVDKGYKGVVICNGKKYIQR